MGHGSGKIMGCIWWMAIYMYWAGSGVFSWYNFIAELTSSHKIWQQVLRCRSEMKLQPSIMSKWGPEAEWIELHQYLSPAVMDPLSGNRTNGRGEKTGLFLSWNSAVCLGKSSVPPLHCTDHSLHPMDMLPKALGVNHNHISPIDSQHHFRDDAPLLVLIFHWQGLWALPHCVTSAQQLMIYERNLNAPEAVPTWRNYQSKYFKWTLFEMKIIAEVFIFGLVVWDFVSSNCERGLFECCLRGTPVLFKLIFLGEWVSITLCEIRTYSVYNLYLLEFSWHEPCCFQEL